MPRLRHLLPMLAVFVSSCGSEAIATDEGRDVYAVEWVLDLQNCGDPFGAGLTGCNWGVEGEEFPLRFRALDDANLPVAGARLHVAGINAILLSADTVTTDADGVADVLLRLPSVEGSVEGGFATAGVAVQELTLEGRSQVGPIEVKPKPAKVEVRPDSVVLVGLEASTWIMTVVSDDTGGPIRAIYPRYTVLDTAVVHLRGCDAGCSGGERGLSSELLAHAYGSTQIVVEFRSVSDTVPVRVVPAP